MTHISLEQLHAVLDRESALTYDGFGVCWLGRTADTAAQFPLKREYLRAAMPEVEIACRWLSLVSPAKTITKKVSSYGMKHLAEDYSRLNDWGLTYVSNGAFLSAAIHMGFRYRQIDAGLNAWLNVSFRSVVPLMKAVGWCV